MNKLDPTWHYLLKTKRFRIAWHSLGGWMHGGWWIRSWFFSFRIRNGYAEKVNMWGTWWQICVLGINIGYLYKIDKP